MTRAARAGIFGVAAIGFMLAGCGGGGSTGGGSGGTNRGAVNVTGISPDHGGAGDTITVTGSGFSKLAPPVVVWFGGTASYSTTVVSDTTITVTVPTYFAQASYPIVVGEATGSLSSAYGSAYYSYTRVN